MAIAEPERHYSLSGIAAAPLFLREKRELSWSHPYKLVMHQPFADELYLQVGILHSPDLTALQRLQRHSAFVLHVAQTANGSEHSIRTRKSCRPSLPAVAYGFRRQIAFDNGGPEELWRSILPGLFDSRHGDGILAAGVGQQRRGLSRVSLATSGANS